MMKIAVINSGQDPAGMHIRRQLLDLLKNPAGRPVEHNGHLLTFLETEGRLIYERNIGERADADLILFISRHTSIQPVPALTVHVTGNFGEAVYGGEEGALAMAAPAWMHAILRRLRANAPEGYRVSYEVTHHGPTDLEVPSLFAEIGSTCEEWADPEAAVAVARSILEARPETVIPLVGFGGNHYASRQTSIALESSAAFGHIVHTRDVEHLDEEMIAEMVRRSGAVAAYIDRKALKRPVLRRVEEQLDTLGIIRVTESELRSLGDLDWRTYERIRALAEGVAPGCRLHVHSLGGEGEPVAFGLEEELVGEALRVESDELVHRLEQLPLAHLSSPKRVVLPIFISYEKNRSTLIHGLISSCIDIIMRNEPTAIRGDFLIIQKMRFDPQKARNLGIPEGPLFGRLATGREIEIEGKTVTPDMVSVSSERVIHIAGLERYL